MLFCLIDISEVGQKHCISGVVTYASDKGDQSINL